MTLALLVALGCRSHGSDGVPGDADADRADVGPTDVGSGTAATGATGDTGAPPSFTASCFVQKLNALRVTCDVSVYPPAAIEVTLTPSASTTGPAVGGAARTASSTLVAAEHRVTVWRLYQDTEYDWVAAPIPGTGGPDGLVASGQVTTGVLPATSAITVRPTGSTTATDDLLFQMDCAAPMAMVTDADGALVWYQALNDGLGPSSVQAVSFTDDGAVAAIVNRSRVRTFGLDGALRVDAVKGAGGFDKFVHHDVFGRGGYLYVLNADTYDVNDVDYILDGVYVFDGAGQVVDEWELASVVTPSGGSGFFGGYWGGTFPGGIDWAHGNGLYVDAAGDWLVSLFELDAIVKVDRDPLSAGFGQLAWVLAGDGPTAWPSDFAITDPDALTDDDTFGHQHHPSLLPDGTLMMLDNERVGEARILQLGLDAGAGTAAIRGSYPIGEVCPFEGAAYPLDNGHLLATCAQTRQLIEVDPATGEVVHTLTPGCAIPLDAGALLARGIPVRL